MEFSEASSGGKKSRDEKKGGTLGGVLLPAGFHDLGHY